MLKRPGGKFQVVALTQEQREKLLPSFRDRLRTDGDSERMLRAIASAIAFYHLESSVGTASQGSRKKMLRGLADVRDAASALAQSLKALSSEAVTTLAEEALPNIDWAELFERTATPESFEPPSLGSPRQLGGLHPLLENGPLYSRDSLDALATDSLVLSRKAEAARRYVDEAPTRAGRPKDKAARALAFRLGLAWRRETDGNMAMDRIDGGAWGGFVRTVFAVAGIRKRGDWYARQISEWFARS